MRPPAGGPRKVVLGSLMYSMWHAYPGLEIRLRELSARVDEMGQAARRRFPGSGLDIAALPEVAVSGGLEGRGPEVSFPLEGPVLEIMGDAARRNDCYVVVPLYLADHPVRGPWSNAAALLDRSGRLVGTYRKVFLVVDRGAAAGEAGAEPGTSFPVFDCDFGRVGFQICWDMAFDEGWDALARRGAELIVWPTQWPGRVHPAARALRSRAFILSSTWRNNASLIDPTGHVVADTRSEGVLVEQVDLSYEILAWQSALRNGAAFDDAYGARAGYRYSEEEDCGIFWSNDPALPIQEMVRALGLETKAEEVRRTRQVLFGERGSPSFD
jgi:predicted amidohydrolase